MRRRALAVPLLALAACATRSDVDSLPSDAGIPKTYAFPFEKVLPACENSLAELGFKKVEKYTRSIAAQRFRLLSSQGVTGESSGRFARIDIENQNTQCTVWVVLLSKVKSREAEAVENAIAEDLHKRIAARLK
jgi:hypothetical protein